MADKKDLVVKMTINSTDFEHGLKNAKSSMNDFGNGASRAAAGVKASFGAIMAAVTAAAGAIETFKKAMRGTEQGADAMDRSLHVATVTTNKFFQALSSGNMEGFITGLKDIAKNARVAYEELDKLGTMKMWGNARISQLQAQIAEDRVIVNSSSSTDAQRKEAQERIRINTEKINALSGDLVEQTTNALQAKLREMAGAGDKITNGMLESYVKSFEAGTLAEEAKQIYERHAQRKTEAVYGRNGEFLGTTTKEIWDNDRWKQVYNAMHNLATITEGEGGWKDYYDLINEQSAQRIKTANLENKANTLIDKGGSGDGGSVITESQAKMTGEQIAEFTRLSLQEQMLQDDRMRDMALIDIEIPNEEIIEEDTDRLVEAIIHAKEEMALLGQNTEMALSAASSLGMAFQSMGKISDSTLGKIFSMLGSVISQIVQTITAMSTLLSVEAAEGTAEVFANEPGELAAKLGAAAAAAAGIAAIIATVKSTMAGSFAEGGIVPGTSYTGDRLWARVNSGEMILNQTQQAALFGGGGGQVRFVIEGSQLKGVLDNYETIQNL